MAIYDVPLILTVPPSLADDIFAAASQAGHSPQAEVLLWLHEHQATRRRIAEALTKIKAYLDDDDDMPFNPS